MLLKSFASIRRPSLTLLQFNALLALWMASLINVGFYQALNALSSLHSVAGGIFILSAIVLVFAYYLLILQLLSWRFSAKVLGSILIILSAFSSYFVYELGVDINQGQIINVMQTDPHEILDLISWQAVEWAVFLLILPCAVLGWIHLKPQPLKQQLLHKLLASMGALVVIVGIVFVYYSQFAPIFREHRHLKDKLTPNNVISSLVSYSKRSIHFKPKPLVQYGTDARLQPAAAALPVRVMVLVIGETGRAESFSLNGYGKDTNPQLAKLDVLNFSKAASCGTETAVSVPCMFSGMPRQQYDADLASHREGLLDIAKRAGYEVTWIDNNSGCKKTCDRVNNYPIAAALKQKWCTDNECLDDILLDSLDAYLKQLAQQAQPKNQLIVLHQMGSHGPAYYKRYPDTFKKFLPTCDTNAIQNCSHQSLINTYDNTILYTDYILASVIERLQQQSRFQTGMWYVSDHGESTGEHGLYLHGAPYMIAPTQQTHVPMILWFSSAWQQQHPALLPCLKQQLDLPRGQDNLFPSLLSMLNIQTEVSDPHLDLLSLCHS
ncbi:MAG: phosphoethanolamine--lipid A transferase [Moraxellaceae bacterium]|nr:MAG: phosphoethanolamine--lipid A transferase [Moraxellaceae bacterium]